MVENTNDSVEKILSKSIEDLKSFIDVNSVVGSPIIIGKTTIIPIVKVGIGFVNGGGQYSSKKDKFPLLSAGNGGGCGICPIGFLSIVDDKVKLINIDGKTPLEKVFEVVPEILEKFVCKKGGKK